MMLKCMSVRHKQNGTNTEMPSSRVYNFSLLFRFSKTFQLGPLQISRDQKALVTLCAALPKRINETLQKKKAPTQSDHVELDFQHFFRQLFLSCLKWKWTFCLDSDRMQFLELCEYWFCFFPLNALHVGRNKKNLSPWLKKSDVNLNNASNELSISCQKAICSWNLLWNETKKPQMRNAIEAVNRFTKR